MARDAHESQDQSPGGYSSDPGWGVAAMTTPLLNTNFIQSGYRKSPLSEVPERSVSCSDRITEQPFSSFPGEKAKKGGRALMRKL